MSLSDPVDPLKFDTFCLDSTLLFQERIKHHATVSAFFFLANAVETQIFSPLIHFSIQQFVFQLFVPVLTELARFFSGRCRFVDLRIEFLEAILQLFYGGPRGRLIIF